ADPAHPVLDECRIARTIDRGAVAPLRPSGHRQIAEAGCRPVGPGQYREHAPSLPGALTIERANARMGKWRAQDGAENHARQHHIVDVAATAAQQSRVLEARNALPDRKLAHQMPRMLAMDEGKRRRASDAAARRRTAATTMRIVIGS